MFKHSERLNAIFAENAAGMIDVPTFTVGHDNDGSTGLDMVEIGIVIGVELGFARRVDPKDEFSCAWVAVHDHEGISIIARTEDEAEFKLREILS